MADFLSRFVAYLIDSTLLSGLVGLIAIPLYLLLLQTKLEELSRLQVTQDASGSITAGTSVSTRGFFETLLVVYGALILISLIAHYLYFVEVLLRRGQTLGKKAMNIAVAPLDPGARLTRGIVAKRFLVEILVGSVVPFFTLIDALWQLRDQRYQQTLHDKFAKTVVVKVSP